MSAAIAGARASGSSGETIVFIHGVGSTAAVWDHQLREFGTTHRCLAVELRGNGASKPEPPAQSITREGFAADVLTVTDAACASKVHVVGCSLGGVVAFEMWKAAPHRVASLTLVGSFAAYDDGRAYAQGVVDAVRQAGSMERFALERTAKLGLPPGPRTDETIAQMACKSVDSYIAATWATWTGDYRALLPSITVPTLVCRGEHDSVAPERYALEMAAAIPGARNLVVAGAGHVANADAPGHFNRMLKSFLESLS